MIKAHLTGANEPLLEGQNYQAICGAVVEDARFRFFFDEEFRSLSAALKRTRVCHKCIAAQIYLEGSYVYGIISAQKLPESEIAEEEMVA